MPGSLTVRQARLVLPDRVVTGDLVVEDGVITEIAPRVARVVGEEIDGAGLTVLPGLIDAQARMGIPRWGGEELVGEDLLSGSQAAAAGGVTAFLDPGVEPLTTVERLSQRLAQAASQSAAHFGFFITAAQGAVDQVRQAERTPGVRLFTGGPEPVDLEEVFLAANKPVALHAIDDARLRERRQLYEGSTDPADHPRIYDVETTLPLVQRAMELATKHGDYLHLTHTSSAEEVALLSGLDRDQVSSQVGVAHLFLEAPDCYDTLGTRAVADPPIRGQRHVEALWKALHHNQIHCIVSDHVPWPAGLKDQPYPDTPPGLPTVELLLPLLLDAASQGRCTLQQIARWTSEAPAEIYRIPRKGRLEIGYDGDLVLVDLAREQVVEASALRSRAGWSPFEGRVLSGWPVLTVLLGQPVFRDGQIVEGVRGRELIFRSTAT